MLVTLHCLFTFSVDKTVSKLDGEPLLSIFQLYGEAQIRIGSPHGRAEAVGRPKRSEP